MGSIDTLSYNQWKAAVETYRKALGAFDSSAADTIDLVFGNKSPREYFKKMFDPALRESTGGKKVPFRDDDTWYVHPRTYNTDTCHDCLSDYIPFDTSAYSIPEL